MARPATEKRQTRERRHHPGCGGPRPRGTVVIGEVEKDGAPMLYGRALVTAPLNVWAGDTARLAEARAAFIHPARCKAAARIDEYVEWMEPPLAA